MSDDKWLDELLDKTEKEEILDTLKRALEYLDDLDVKKAYNVLELLYESLGGEYDAGKYMNVVVPKVPYENPSPSAGPPDHGDLNHMHYGHDHTIAIDQAIEDISAQTVERVMNEIEERILGREEEMREMAETWGGLAAQAEQKMGQIDLDQAYIEKVMEAYGERNR